MSRLLPVDQIDPSPFSDLSPPDEENQQQIAEDLERTGEVLVPLHVVEKDGGRWELLAGHDRLEAAKLAGLTEVPVRDFSGTVITEEEKASHVLRENNLRKHAPKRAGVEWWLVRHPEWSDRRIAEEVGCSNTFVGKVRAAMERAGSLSTVDSREGQDGRTIQTDTIGSKPATPETPPPAPKPVSKLGSLEAQRQEGAADHNPRFRQDDGEGEETKGADDPDTGTPQRERSKVEQSLITGEEKRTQRSNTYAAVARLHYLADTIRGPKNIDHVVAVLTGHSDEFERYQKMTVPQVLEACETVQEWLPAFADALRSKMEDTDAAAA